MADWCDKELRYQNVDTVLQEWRQGDCILGEQWFIHRFDPESPLREESAKVADQRVDLAESSVHGLVVLTQTCDIVRKSRERPFVEVAPIVEVADKLLHEIARGYRPGYAIIPTLYDQRLVADLDRTMTVEKAVVAKWQRTVGCHTDHEVRLFSLALARKRARHPFPDDFTVFAKELQERLLDKHDKQSDEGRALRALSEIRVRAAPSWDAAEIELTFWFIRQEDEIRFEDQSWAPFLSAWLKLIPPSGRFVSVDGLVVTLEDLTAKEYVESDPLDLDHLSIREE